MQRQELIATCSVYGTVLSAFVAQDTATGSPLQCVSFEILCHLGSATVVSFDRASTSTLHMHSCFKMARKCVFCIGCCGCKHVLDPQHNRLNCILRIIDYAKRIQTYVPQVRARDV